MSVMFSFVQEWFGYLMGNTKVMVFSCIYLPPCLGLGFFGAFGRRVLFSSLVGWLAGRTGRGRMAEMVHEYELTDDNT